METKINITTILKDKPKGTKLYSTVHGKCTFKSITDEIFKINFCTSKFGLTQTGECVLIKFGNMFDGGECVVFPSKEMRDWSKFAWKRGDVLINDAGYKIFFDKWENDDYTRFFGSVKVHCYDTEDYTLASKEEAQEFIKSIEKTYGGKLNRETLEIEKQLEFKDGDIVALVVRKCTHIAIFQSRQEAYIGFHAVLCQNDELLLEEPFREDVGDIELRLATDSEKQQLFDALAKEGKAWDAEKKQIVDLKPKVKFKPFEKVLVRDSKASEWRANLFSHKNINGPYYCVYASWNYCIPYEGNEHLLGTTKNVGE